MCDIKPKTDKFNFDFPQAIKERAAVLRKKGLSEFEIAIFLTFALLPFMSLLD